MGTTSGRSRQLSAICLLLVPHQGSVGFSWIPTLVIVETHWGCRRGAGAAGMLLVLSPWA